MRWSSLALVLVVTCQANAHATHEALNSTVRVALAQILVLSSDREGNLVRMEHATRAAKVQGAQIVVFPEMSLYGWINPDVFNTSVPIPGRDSIAVAAMAEKHQIMVVCGFAERAEDGQGVYDSAVLFDSDGAILLKHRKIHILSSLMSPAYTPGKADASNIHAVDTKIGRVGVLICADTMPSPQWAHPNVLDAMRTAAPQLLVVPYGIVQPTRNWPEFADNFRGVVVTTAANTSATVLGIDSVGQVMDGPWKGQVDGGWSYIALPGSLTSSGVAEALDRVGADRDTDLIVLTVPIPAHGI